jgi:oxalate decarboxylase/phosphoglucose isomerase-like protein (cupin superfamily)
VPKIIEEDALDLIAFAEELSAAREHVQIGTSLWFENERVRVWEVRLDPGEGAPFHAHVHPYFWTCVAAGIGRQRSSDGAIRILGYEEGDTNYSEHSIDDSLIHDLRNVGDTVLRFVTVELLG